MLDSRQLEIISFRPGKDRAAQLASWAETRGYTAIGTAMNDLIDSVLEGKPQLSPKEILAEAERKAAHLGLRNPVNSRRRWGA